MRKDYMKNRIFFTLVILMLVEVGIVVGQESEINKPAIPKVGAAMERENETNNLATIPVASENLKNAPIATTRAATSAIPPILSNTVRDASSSQVAVNWENVTLKDCIEVLCRDLGMEFIISPAVNVSQEVSVRAGDVTNWSREDKLELFDAILDTAGVQRIQRGRVWVFAPSNIRPVLQGYEGDAYSKGQPVIGVLRLKYIDAKSATDFLNTVGGKPPLVYGLNGSQIIMVIGTHAYLKQMEDLLKLIDVPPSVMKAFTLKEADAEELASELTNIFYRRTGGDGQPVRFVPITRLNIVVAYNATPKTLEEIEKWVQILDRTEEENERITKVYRMQVIEAEKIAKTLSELYSSIYRQNLERERIIGTKTRKLQKTMIPKKSTSSNSHKSSSRPTSSKSSKSTKKSSKSSSKSSKSSGSSATASRAPSVSSRPSAPTAGSKTTSSASVVDEEAIILADEETNTLIINAPAEMHKEIERTINELDRARRQVLIETVLVEVTLDENLDLGIEWAVSEGGIAANGKTVSSAGLQAGGELGKAVYPFTDAKTGISYLIESSKKKMALIQAAENDDRLQVLSSPTVLTRDGMEAEISFGEEVPIQQKTVSDAGRENYSFDYRDAKMTLKVTPHIDDFEMVTLTLEQELRSVNPSTSGDVAPSFFTRELRSNLQVESGQTLVLGGLIQRKDQKITTGIPWLNRIPYIGWIFGRNQIIKQGSEILMILTPHVVETRDETDLLTREFRNKILGAMSEKNIRKLYNLEDGPYPLLKPEEESVELPANPEVIIEDFSPSSIPDEKTVSVEEK